MDREIVVIDIDDPHAAFGELTVLGVLEYACFRLSGDKNFNSVRTKDEGQGISQSYTSRSTGNRKGVEYHDRGSHLKSMGSVRAWTMPNRLTYLYTVSMFHSTGWGYPWTVDMLHARVLFVRNIIVRDNFDLIAKSGVTHFGGAPIVLNMIAITPEPDLTPR